MGKALVQSGLPVEVMPNAFRISAKEIETRKSTGHVGVFENFFIREVFSDKSQSAEKYCGGDCGSGG